MARGDPFFARVDCNWFMGGKTSQLSQAERDTYLNGLWLLAVENRRQRLPAGHSSGIRLAYRLAICPKTARRHLDKLSRVGLITIHDNGDVTVHGVKDCHPKLKWKDSPYPPHTGMSDFPIRGSNYSIPILKTLPPPSPPEGKVSTKVDGRGEPEMEPARVPQHELIRRHVNATADRIMHGLSLDEKQLPQIKALLYRYPHDEVIDAMMAARDKQCRIASGEDRQPFTTGPLAYMAGYLKRRRMNDPDRSAP